MKQSPVIVIGGPTACGKSGLALAIAENFDGIIVNADAIQVYRDLRILTARPTEDEEKRIPHRLYGILDAKESCSAGTWQALALKEIENIQNIGKLPIIVGGTGLYLKALTEGIAPIPKIPLSVRKSVREFYSEVGKAEFYTQFTKKDPITAARIQPNDAQRLMRAWEVMEATGKSISLWQEEKMQSPNLKFTMVVGTPLRETLYAACDKRIFNMISDGVLEEVKALMIRFQNEKFNNLPVFKAIAFKEFSSYLAGDTTLDIAITKAQQQTRRYAKRQMTWFRNQTNIEAGNKKRNVKVLKYSYLNHDKIISDIS
ncbi:MAG: tRNA (adenosine(37)-N6)-dimethylallyltransferase MiaA [Rhodospirillaceae bacterium]|nr:tRNA (adenosine(37)-N6)-dimethylallyltransferase MiaA [Rhodospirillaceae bacterium]